MTLQTPAFHLMLACNNPDNGMFTGLFSTAEVEHSRHGEGLLKLCGPDTRVEHQLSMAMPRHRLMLRHRLRIGRIIVPCGPEVEWCGNWVWNLYKLDLPAMVRVLGYLHGRGFDVEHGETALMDRWKAGAPTAEDLMGVIEPEGSEAT